MLSLVGLIAGCNTTRKAGGDPLVGEWPKGVNPTPPAAPVKSTMDVPPIPSSATAMSTAALAAGDPLPGARTLAIGLPQDSAVKPGFQGTLTGAGKTPNLPTPGATLTNPQPIVEPVPRAVDNPVTPAGSWAGPPSAAAAPPKTPAVTPAAASAASAAVGPMTNDALLAQLKAHNVTFQKADNVPGGVRFSCIVPNQQNPGRSRVYEATGPDYGSAVRAVLWKIDQQK